MTLQAIQGYGTKDTTVRTGSNGQFGFTGLDKGAYLIAVTKRAYAPLKHGQKAWNAPATPLFLDADDSPFLTFRLRRMGAISGIVWDENDIGHPDVEVYVYKPTRPPSQVAHAKADERGAFRIGGLFPGEYLVRTDAARLEDGSGILPTFHKETTVVDEARTARVEFDQETTDITICPAYGRLFKLGGRILPTGPSLTVTLASDMARRVTGADAAGNFGFEGLAPGLYELTVEGLMYGTPASRYERIVLDKDMEGIRINLTPSPMVEVVIEEREGAKIDPKGITVQARRKDLAGEGPPKTLSAERTVLSEGRWELLVQTPPQFYPVSISDTRRSSAHGRADVWTEIVPMGGRIPQKIRVSVSAKPGSVRGKVTGSGNNPAIGAPVYLEPMDDEGQRRLMDPRVAIAGLHGDYVFSGLPPGRYRLVSSFDFEAPDEQTMEYARPKAVVVKEGGEAVQDLELYVRP